MLRNFHNLCSRKDSVQAGIAIPQLFCAFELSHDVSKHRSRIGIFLLVKSTFGIFEFGLVVQCFSKSADIRRKM